MAFYLRTAHVIGQHAFTHVHTYVHMPGMAYMYMAGLFSQMPPPPNREKVWTRGIIDPPT